jgi:hypothetical protein
MHQILTHLVAVIDTSKDPHELVSKALAVSKLSYAQARARDLRLQHTDINHLVVIAEIIQVKRRSEDIYTTDPRELGIAKSDDGWIEWKGGKCPVGPDVLVEIKVRYTGMVYTDKALNWSWGLNEDEVSYITWYRVVK